MNPKPINKDVMRWDSSTFFLAQLVEKTFTFVGRTRYLQMRALKDMSKHCGQASG